MIIDFPGPLSREQATSLSLGKGAVCSIDNDGHEIVIFGSPTAMELLWLAEQLRLKALYEDDEIEDEISG